MKSKIDPQFRKLLRALPNDVRAQARASYRLFKKDPYHPSLHFKEIAHDVYSARIGIKYRALGTRVADDLILWWWIGSHTDYDKLVK
ncbi:MAG: hypothetical protein U0694_28695 [Anaerolineae bacterium]